MQLVVGFLNGLFQGQEIHGIQSFPAQPFDNIQFEYIDLFNVLSNV